MNFFLAFISESISSLYRCILKLSINASQLIAYWRTRINREQQSASRSSTFSPDHHLSSTTNHSRTTSTTTQTGSNNIQLLQPGDISPSGESGEPTSSATNRSASSGIKTPHQRHSKIFSLLRRLSLRNFMEYCVIALNEASSSSGSNKFDIASSNGIVWILGCQYMIPRDADCLYGDIRSKIWITYRKNFPPIDGNLRYTTDRGFGCMIRCGQMVLANALLYKSLGRDWHWQPTAIEANPEIYIKILKLFQDKEESLYSIHNIVQSGQNEGKSIGEWFGPNTIAQALKRIALAKSQDNKPNDIELLISIDAALDNVVVVDEIKSRFRYNSSNSDAEGDGSKLPDEGSNSNTVTRKTGQWLPGVLFIQLRLGLTKINPLYFDALRHTFKFKNSLGIIGGRPNHALYLIGFTGDDVMYLDPHNTQQFIDLDSQNATDGQPEDDLKALPLDSTYHYCDWPEMMNIDRLDPSLALCFYFQDEQDFDDWCKRSENDLIKSEQAPMFEIISSRPTDWNTTLSSVSVKSETKVPSHLGGTSAGPASQTADDKSGGDTKDTMNQPDKSSADTFEDVEHTLDDSRGGSNEDEEFEMLG